MKLLCVTFYDVKRKEAITAFLDTKMKSIEEHPDKKRISTWNDYLNDIKYFFLDDYITTKRKIERMRQGKKEIAFSDCEIPSFARIEKRIVKNLTLV